MKEKLKSILYSLETIKKRFNINFNIRIVPGTNASIQPNNLICIGLDFIEQENENELKAIIYHETFHQIFPELNQHSLSIKSKEIGKRFEEMIEYWESEINTWNKVKEIFPKVSNECDHFIKYSLIIIEKLKLEK